MDDAPLTADDVTRSYRSATSASSGCGSRTSWAS